MVSSRPSSALLHTCPTLVQAGSLQQYTDPAVGQKQAIERLTYGFPLPSGDLNGICSPTGLTPVRYGFNTTSTCAQPLTLSGLQNVCE